MGIDGGHVVDGERGRFVARLLQGQYSNDITILLQTCFADFVTFLLYHLIT